MAWECGVFIDDYVILAAGELDGMQAFFWMNPGEVESIRIDLRADNSGLSGSDDVAIVGSALLLFLFSAWLEAFYVGANLFNGFTFGGVVGDDALLGQAISGGCQGGFVARAEEVGEVRHPEEQAMSNEQTSQKNSEIF